MRVYFSRAFLRSYFQASPTVRQAFNSRLHLFMAKPTDPQLQLRQLADEFAAYYVFAITNNWDVVIHPYEKDIIVFDTLGLRREMYPAGA